MSKKRNISTKDLNRAMQRTSQRAIRTNKALGLDNVYVKGKIVIREHADGSATSIQKLNGKTSSANTIKGPLKIG